MISNKFSTPSLRKNSLTILPLLVVLYRPLKSPARPSKVPESGERVLTLGASSGLGRTTTRKCYAFKLHRRPSTGTVERSGSTTRGQDDHEKYRKRYVSANTRRLRILRPNFGAAR